MIISIASGKGGTGKTTVATNLAAAIGAGAQLLDCDVEEPNAHLFLNPAFEKTETITVSVPEVGEALCAITRPPYRRPSDTRRHQRRHTRRSIDIPWHHGG